MARIPEEEVAEVRRRADIADIIGRYLTVQKRGREYRAVCPFHDDHDPSLHINPDMQIYKCFVCGAGGNMFTFVQNYENVSFPEAVEKVADLIGFPLSVKVDRTVVQQDPQKERYHNVLKETIRFTCYEINSEEAKEAKAYLDKRGMDETIRGQFEIGFNPGNDRLSKFLKAKGFSEADMVSVNVARTGASGISDVFANRITFPIHDAAGNPIGFSARTMDPDNPSKYVNTTDTPLFHKGEIVYNAHRARMSARREGKVYVCEGVTDVIAFARAGVQNAVCTLGTSCTKQQIEILHHMAPRVIFCYDGDAAGQNATMKAGRLAREAGCEVAVVDNRTGLDPDELTRKEGADAFKAMLGKELIWMEFVLQYLKNRTNFDNYQERKDFVTKAKAELDTLTDEVDRRYFTEEISRISGFHLDYTPKEAHTAPSTYARTKLIGGLDQAEEIILAMMLAHKEASQHFSETLGFLQNKDRDSVAMMIVDSYRTKDVIDPNELIDRMDTQENRNLITRLIDQPVYAMEYDENVLDGAIRKVKISLKTAQANAFKEQLAQPMNPESALVIMQEYKECLNDLRRYIDEEANEINRN
ncbi:MAG: DNA primase [Solobacterium sp.]|nr:DNA primase [Solobacterium sp.]